MKKLDMDELTNHYYDVLKELGNIGAGNATTALAQMIDCKVDMSVPLLLPLPLPRPLLPPPWWKRSPRPTRSRSNAASQVTTILS